MNAMASQISSLTIVYSTVYSGADQRKHQSSASLAFVRGIYRWPVNSTHKRPVTRKMFSFDDVIMYRENPQYVMTYVITKKEHCQNETENHIEFRRELSFCCNLQVSSDKVDAFEMYREPQMPWKYNYKLRVKCIWRISNYAKIWSFLIHTFINLSWWMTYDGIFRWFHLEIVGKIRRIWTVP